jgi:hypothetical protein
METPSMAPEEIAAKVRASVAFFLELNIPETPAQIATFDAKSLKARPVRDEQADNIATSIRKKMRKEKKTFLLSIVEVQNQRLVSDLITLVQGRM